MDTTFRWILFRGCLGHTITSPERILTSVSFPGLLKHTQASMLALVKASCDLLAKALWPTAWELLLPQDLQGPSARSSMWSMFSGGLILRDLPEVRSDERGGHRSEGPVRSRELGASAKVYRGVPRNIWRSFSSSSAWCCAYNGSNCSCCRINR